MVIREGQLERGLSWQLCWSCVLSVLGLGFESYNVFVHVHVLLSLHEQLGMGRPRKGCEVLGVLGFKATTHSRSPGRVPLQSCPLRPLGR